MFKRLRPMKSVKELLHQVNSWAERIEPLTDQQLRDKTITFKKRLEQGETLDDLLPEAYAVVREADRRVLGMFPYDVQVMGAIVMHQGHIAEMSTGEGKTLTATMPIYLNALTGEGAILVTTNEYLAKRDAEEAYLSAFHLHQMEKIWKHQINVRFMHLTLSIRRIAVSDLIT